MFEDMMYSLRTQPKVSQAPGLVVGTVRKNYDAKEPGKVMVEYTLGESGKMLTGWIPVLAPYTTDKAKIIVREMTELLVLDMVRKHVVTDNITLDINYDRENVDNGKYMGELQVDHYGRLVPMHSHGTANLNKHTSSTAIIVNALMELYDRIIDEELTVRRVTLSANNLRKEDEIFEQFDIFTDPEKLEQEKRLQNAMLTIQDKYGKNAILKGTNLLDGATTIERNGQIGGHKS